MQLSTDTTGPIRVITGYGPRQLRVGDELVTASVIVTADRIVPWPVTCAATLAPADLEPVLALGAEVVLLATGARQVWPPPAVFAHAAARRVGIEVMEIGAACRTFNVLLADRRAVALAVVIAPD